MPRSDWITPQMLAMERAIERRLASLEKIVDRYATSPARLDVPSIVPVRRHFLEAEVEFIRRHYPLSRARDIAQALACKVDAVHRAAWKLGLRKAADFYDHLASDPEWHAARSAQAAANGYPKGHVPANKGKKMPPGFSPGRMASTQFKKGQRNGVAATRLAAIGSHRVADGVVWVKVADVPGGPWTVNWRQVHRLVWEGAHGPVPDGHVVRFKPGQKTLDPALITLDRLELLTWRENLARNSVHNLPKPLVKVVQLRGILNRSINKRAKRDERQQQDHH